MAMQRVTLSAIFAALQLVIVPAFLPAGALSHCEWRPSALKQESSFSRNLEQHTSSAKFRGGATTSLATKTSESEATMSGGEDDLYIVGYGFLGKLVGAQWQEKFPSAKIYGETRTRNRHLDSIPESVVHSIRKEREEQMVKCANVVFCAPPSGNENYADELFLAMRDIWDKSGMFVFTSTGGVYEEHLGGVVTEDSPVIKKFRVTGLRDAEKITLMGDGSVIRLAGLYDINRGPHSAWLDEKRLEKHAEGLINLVSYEDAATAVVLALDAGRKEKCTDGGDADSSTPKIKGRIFIAADSEPTSRRKICEAAHEHPLHHWKDMPKFNTEGDGAGARKLYDSTVTRRDLGWEPRWKSFTSYFAAAVEEARLEEEKADREEQELEKNQEQGV